MKIALLASVFINGLAWIIQLAAEKILQRRWGSMPGTKNDLSLWHSWTIGFMVRLSGLAVFGSFAMFSPYYTTVRHAGLSGVTAKDAILAYFVVYGLMVILDICLTSRKAMLSIRSKETE